MDFSYEKKVIYNFNFGCRNYFQSIFVFDKSYKYSFWMKDMLFPIDIIWIGEDFSVVDITENAEPNSYPNLFTPREEALYVLEVNAGFSNEKGLKIGDKVEFK